MVKYIIFHITERCLFYRKVTLPNQLQIEKKNNKKAYILINSYLFKVIF